MHSPLLLLWIVTQGHSYLQVTSTRLNSGKALTMNCNIPDVEGEGEGLTSVGSKEYYRGFFNSYLIDESVNSSERGNGLEQALKLGSGAAAFLTLLTLLFMKSNGIV